MLPTPENTRRAVLAGLGGAAMMASGQARAVEKNSPPMNKLAYVGCRTTRERNARGDGIVVYQIDGDSWTKVQLVDGLLNPSYLAFDNQKRFLYTVHGDSSEISAFRIRQDGTLAFLNKVSCQGKNPVHLCPDPTNQFLLVANHLTVEGYVSNVAVLPRHDDGSLGAVSDLVQLRGQIGPHRTEQPFAKPHQVAYDPHHRFIAVPDKGCDLVRSFALDAAGKLKEAAPAVTARPGAGPRHIAFTPDSRFGYVINELDSTVTAYRYDPASGALSPFQRLASTPDNFTGYSTGAEIAIPASGRFVYVSNRGHDSIGIFSVDLHDGRLTPRGWVACDGKTPRFFSLSPDETRLYVANEDGDTITAFAVNSASGMLSPLGVAARTGSPTCIIFSA